MPSAATEAPPTLASPARSNAMPSVVLYALTIFLGAFLLFQVQLIIGKYILPWFGGSPSVWNTCLLLFQVLLLLGYLYAHTISTRLAMRSQIRLHVALLLVSFAALAFMARQWPSPITPGPAWKPMAQGSPEWRVILVLLVSVGFPFVILATTGPLLQVWLSRARSGSPYRFYALSNAGSLLGLLSYPFFVERFLLLGRQAWVWSAAYAVFLLAYAACAWSLRSPSSGGENPPPPSSAVSEKPQTLHKLMWLAFSACASAMLLATTNLICQEIAVIPLLWVLPLCVYLLTFILCFGNENWYSRGIFYPLYAWAFAAALIVLSTPPQKAPHVLVEIGVFCAALFAVCMVCHGELVQRKPTPAYLSTFYLAVSAGGALGSIFVVLIAPRIFHRFWEFQLSLLLCGILMLLASFLDKESWFFKLPMLRLLLYAAILGIAILGYRYGQELIRRDEGKQVAFRDRNFFGVKTGIEDSVGHWLMHGRTQHGVQLRDPALHDEPSLYYRRLSGVGLLLDHYPALSEALPGAPSSLRKPLQVGVVGLGAGTLAAYGHRGDRFRFYEIDPQVVALSLGPKPFFSFLQDSPAKIEIALGDARLSLEREAAAGQFGKFDVLVLDAFSSDAVPVHLLTQEAMALYLRHLSGPNAVLAFHLSNRALDLRPVAYALSTASGMSTVEVEQPGASLWVLASANPAMLAAPELRSRSKPVTVVEPVPLWTDEYSNLFDVMRPLH